MSRVANNILDLIGQTPIVRLNRIVGKSDADIFLKLGIFQPRWKRKRSNRFKHDQ